ncbi:MAG: hypothetical protein IIA44_12220, partial [Acidobacteria bacterium]|nr:hypothetical protein [Acidobacteriota bacterium]
MPDFPEAGIVFKDIAPLLGDAAALDKALDLMTDPYRDRDISHVAGIEARGFILATPVAVRIAAGFVPIRKPGKLPWKTVNQNLRIEATLRQEEPPVTLFEGYCRQFEIDKDALSNKAARLSL